MQRQHSTRPEETDHITSWHGYSAALAKTSEETHRKEAPDASPHGVVGQLAPSALMHDGALIDASAGEVDEDGNHDHDTKHAAGAQCLCFLVYAAACERRAAFKKVCAIINCGDKGYGCFSERVRVAEERDDGRLAAFRLLLLSLFAFILAFVIVVVAVNDLPPVKGNWLERALGL